MKKILYILILFTQTAKSQGEAELFVTNDFASEEGIQLKWIYEYLYHPEGFNVYRSSESVSWTKLNTTPIVPRKSLPDGHGLNKEEADLHAALIASPYEDLKVSIIRAFVLIKSIYSNEMAGYSGIMYHDKTAQKGTKYTYKIALVNGATEQELAQSKEIMCSEYIKPMPPENPTLNRKKKYITFNWKPELYRYYGVEIYKKELGEGEYEKITTIGPRAIQPKSAKKYNENSIFFVDTNIVYETGYTYKFEAVDYFNQRSEMSAEVAAPMIDFVPPQMPFGLKLTPNSVIGKVNVVWEAIDEADLAGYNVYTSQNPDSSFVKVNAELISKESKSYDLAGMSVGGHYFSVSSVDIAGNEASSGLMFTEIKDVEPPSAPKNLASEATSGEIQLSWTANTESDLLGYYIQKSLNHKNPEDNRYINVNSTPINETQYTESLSKNIKNKFVYRVVAIDTNFNRSQPSINSLAQMPDIIPPLVPVIKNVSLEGGNIRINWLKNADSDLKGYNLYKSGLNDSITKEQVNINLISSTTSTYLDRRADKGESYLYVIEAVDVTGNVSETSNTFKIAIPKAPVTDTIKVSKANYNVKKKQLLVQWDEIKTQAMKGYVVYLSDALGFLKPASGLSLYTEFKVKKELNTPVEIEVRGYTKDGNIIRSGRTIIKI
ncbi:hypothetical protein OAN33_05810 [Flavobacteriales bacterium]|nr:hypothetical protein [Flavobacteriales bacterium]